jgi:hypothetical protein
MSKRKTKTRRHARPAPHAHGPNHRHSGETRTSDATTVGWTVSVTTVLLCDIAAVAAYLYTQAYPHARSMVLLRELLLIAAAIIGFISLAMLPIVFRVRRAPPPSGVTVFAVCAGAAPILALLVRNLR